MLAQMTEPGSGRDGHGEEPVLGDRGLQGALHRAGMRSNQGYVRPTRGRVHRVGASDPRGGKGIGLAQPRRDLFAELVAHPMTLAVTCVTERAANRRPERRSRTAVFERQAPRVSPAFCIP